MNRSMVIIFDFFCVVFKIVCPWNFFTWIYGVLLLAAIVLAAAGRELTTATPQ